jgi:hypothetical protein
MLSFPYVINFKSNIRYEISYDDLKKIAKAEKNRNFSKAEMAFLTLGMVTLSQAQKGMLIKSMSNRNIYLLVFSPDGEYMRHELLMRGEDYTGNVWFFNGHLCKVEGQQIHYYHVE